MALCDTKIYTDSGEMGETLPETHVILDGKRSRKREGKASPRLGKRRSSRIRKRGAGDQFTDVNSCYSSDDSDPNIQVADDVLIEEEEEKIMIKEESDLVKNQNAEKQILAVALVRSVIDKHKSDEHRKDAIKKEVPVNKPSNNLNDPKVKKEDVNENPTPQPEVKTINNISSQPTQSTKDSDNVRKNVVPKIVMESISNTSSQVQSANNVQTNKPESTILSGNNMKSSTQRSTRSRSRSAKGGRTMALKGAYASVREAPRLPRKPNVAIPVPNPILPSPVPNEINKTKMNVKMNSVVKLEDMMQGRQTAPARNQQAHSQSSNIQSTTTKSVNVAQNSATSTQQGSNTVSFSTTSRHPGNPSAALPKRGRIFSIDFDPEGFDFDMNMGVTCSSPTADIVDSISALPPIISSSSVIENKSSTIQSNTNQPTNISISADESTMQTGRDRGMSFELFSFAQHEVLQTSDPVDLNDEALNGGRPRGDSIIFDPVSFSDGNEEAAFQRIQQAAAQNDNTSNELGMINAPVFDSSSTHFQSNVQPQTISSHGTVASLTKTQSTQQQIRPRTTQNRVSKSTRSTGGDGTSYIRQSKSTSGTVSSCKSKTIHFSGNFPHSDSTIHMPQGSAAAAAAAASLSSQVVVPYINGAISHTACPMELLNKGGRIGIYLPEARRERIAKFHSKRKNRIWRKRIKYDCRKKLADSRPRIKGRFVKSLDE